MSTVVQVVRIRGFHPRDPGSSPGSGFHLNRLNLIHLTHEYLTATLRHTRRIDERSSSGKLSVEEDHKVNILQEFFRLESMLDIRVPTLRLGWDSPIHPSYRPTLYGRGD